MKFPAFASAAESGGAQNVSTAAAKSAHCTKRIAKRIDTSSAITMLMSAMRFIPRACMTAPENAMASAASCMRSRKMIVLPMPMM